MNADDVRGWGGVRGIRSFICSFVCLYKCAINCCLFIFYYTFVYFDFCFLHNFCRLTRMFFSQCAAGFLFYYGKKIQRQTMCEYVFDGYAAVCVLCVLLCLNFWRSVWEWEEEQNIPLRHAHEIDTFHARLLFCCDLLLLL